MKKLILLVGVPGSGKSTLAQRLIDNSGFLCLNADNIRQELWGDPTDQREPEKVFGLFFQRLEDALAKGLDIVIDNTNTNPKHRDPIIARAKHAGYEDIQIWIMDVPLDVCLERNRSRIRAVPDDIVEKMYNTITGPGMPKAREGKVVIVRPGEKDFEYRYFVQAPQKSPRD